MERSSKQSWSCKKNFGTCHDVVKTFIEQFSNFTNTLLDTLTKKLSEDQQTFLDQITRFEKNDKITYCKYYGIIRFY